MVHTQQLCIIRPRHQIGVERPALRIVDTLDVNLPDCGEVERFDVELDVLAEIADTVFPF